MNLDTIDRATSAEAARAHLELANRYLAMIENGAPVVDPSPPLWASGSVFRLSVLRPHHFKFRKPQLWRSDLRT